MLFMSGSEIENARLRLQRDPVLKTAADLLYALMCLANQVSDGWAYWPKPCRAARSLQMLIQAHLRDHARVLPAVKRAQLKRATAPIKAFLTREKKPDWPLEAITEILKKI